MEEKILSFARDLRRGGVPLAVPEVMDALRGIEVTGYHKEIFRAILRATLIKDEMDAPLFNKLFEIYFEPQPELKDNYQEEAKNNSFTDNHVFLSRVFGCDGRGLATGIQGAPRGRLASAVYTGSGPEMEKLAREGVEGLALHRGEEPEDFEELVYQAKAALEWFMFTFYLDSRREKGIIQEEEYVFCQENLKSLENRLRRLLEEKIINKFQEKGLEKILEYQNLRRKVFSRMEEKELEKIGHYALKLGRKLVTRKGRRKKPGLKGQVDLRNTIRKSVGTGGVPLKLSSRGKGIEQPDLLVLCDVSGSVARFSTFMLLFIHSLQERFRYVRTFLFIDLLAEVTDYFKGKDPAKALQEALERAPVSDTNNSDYGRVFYHFASHYSYLITSRTVLLILGDAKNNWRGEEKPAFQEMARRAKRVYWLNPYPEETWDTRDSVMRVYAPYCSGVMECRNLEQLAKVTEELIFQEGVGAR
ncbi:MAG: VWA domain-containing protein [Candidatus Syntrophonatronum acetioxidans]|uniref:VWA domain-containing protein n=1 Tax=Candidatus Syntrophonatronum acetioxidans TaxID=1795816 RepID=A0A424YEK9_9FIRM|nr:MAG: VWA domain-containing protein [Candidatus Syntrophonatronum acetioxidans]